VEYKREEGFGGMGGAMVKRRNVFGLGGLYYECIRTRVEGQVLLADLAPWCVIYWDITTLRVTSSEP
jgi:hypothetical protein